MSAPPKGFTRAQTDREVLVSVLTKALLTPDQKVAFEGALLQLDMIGGRLAKTIRDHAVAVLRAQGLLPRQPEKSPRRPVGTWEEDRFSAVKTDGTKFAEELLSKPLPLKPPGKKAS